MSLHHPYGCGCFTCRQRTRSEVEELAQLYGGRSAQPSGDAPGLGLTVLLALVFFVFAVFAQQYHWLHERVGIDGPISGTVNLIGVGVLLALVFRTRRKRKPRLALTQLLLGSVLLIGACGDRVWYHHPAMQQLADQAPVPSGFTAFGTSGPINIRTGPGTSYPIQATFRPGAGPVYLGPANADGWARVHDLSGQGRTGYMYRASSLLQPWPGD